jgi:hypothetical protein
MSLLTLNGTAWFADDSICKATSSALDAQPWQFNEQDAIERVLDIHFLVVTQLSYSDGCFPRSAPICEANAMRYRSPCSRGRDGKLSCRCCQVVRIPWALPEPFLFSSSNQFTR